MLFIRKQQYLSAYHPRPSLVKHRADMPKTRQGLTEEIESTEWAGIYFSAFLWPLEGSVYKLLYLPKRPTDVKTIGEQPRAGKRDDSLK